MSVNSPPPDFVVVPTLLSDKSVAWQVEAEVGGSRKLILASFTERGAKALAAALNKHVAWSETEELGS
jgi:hypothetical protein